MTGGTTHLHTERHGRGRRGHSGPAVEVVLAGLGEAVSPPAHDHVAV